jgi:ribosomal protein S18 acetylase RimI-like enzyme
MLEWMYSIPSLSRQILEKNHVFLLAKIQEEYLGYASYELNYKNSKGTKIHKIYILPAAQGKGVGKALMEKIIDIATQASNHILSLNVNRNNPAVNFYQKIGFQVVGKEDIDIGNGFLMEDFVMEKIVLST